MRISVQGIGVVGGFGAGVGALKQALESGRSAKSSLNISNKGVPLELPCFRADTRRLTDFAPLRLLRRIDHFSKLALLGAYLALEDAGISAEESQERLGVIIATGYGATGATFAFLDSFIADGDICASPTSFANSVHNSAAANISILLGATGPSSTVSQLHLSVPSALQTARLWLAEGRVDRVLYGAVDEISELIGYAWYRQHGFASCGQMTPLQTASESATIGEGAAFMLLSRKDESKQGYCILEHVETGKHFQPLPEKSPLDLLILGADGRKELGGEYASLAAGYRIGCFTPLYGCMPAGPAFDMAVAALMLKDGVTFSTPQSLECDFPALVADGGNAITGDRISCLTLTNDSGFGLITLGNQKEVLSGS